MFDGLKKKLSSFREDVEESTEEKVEEAAADVSDEEAAAATGSDPGATTDADAGSAEATEPSETAEPAESVETGASGAADGAETDSDGTPVNETSGSSETATSARAAADATPTGTADSATDEADSIDEAHDPTEASDATDPTTADEAETDEGARRPVGAASSREALTASEKPRSGASRLKRAAAFATGKIVIEEEDLEDPLWQLEMALLGSDVEMSVAEEILETIREKMIGETRAQVQSTGELVSEALHDALFDVISVGQFDFEGRVVESDKPVTIIFTGVNGVGKTTSIAKLSRYFEKRGLSTVLANGDTYRAGANEQIGKHADNLGAKLISHEQGGDPAAVLYDAVEYAEAHDIDVVLGDTAGRLHTSSDLMAQLEKIDRVVAPDMTLFVDEAVAGQDAVQRAKKFNEAAEIDGAILTKADADSQGGAAISIAYVTGKPILFLGTGQGYDHLERFDPEALVADLLAEE